MQFHLGVIISKGLENLNVYFRDTDTIPVSIPEGIQLIGKPCTYIVK